MRGVWVRARARPARVVPDLVPDVVAIAEDVVDDGGAALPVAVVVGRRQEALPVRVGDEDRDAIEEAKEKVVSTSVLGLRPLQRPAEVERLWQCKLADARGGYAAGGFG